MRKQLFRHWKRETLEQVQIQGLQLEELQQAVMNLQNSINKMNSQRQTDDENHRKWEEEKIDSISTANQQWQEGKIDAAFTANQQWQEGKIDAAFTANQQWQEAFISNLQQWINEMTKGRTNQVLQNGNQIKDMLETIWHSLPSNLSKEQIPYSLEQKAFLDQTKQTLDKSLEKVKEKYLKTNKPIIAFVGDYVVFPNEAPRRYIEKLEKVHPDYDFIVISEVSWFSEEETIKKIATPFCIVPDIIGAHYLSNKIEVPLTTEELNQVENCDALKEASLKMLKQNPDITESYAKYTALCAYNYYTKLLKHLSPRKLFIFNNFFYLHQIVEQAAKDNEISIKYWEYGTVPGTFMFDDDGLLSMGYPTVQNKLFLNLPISDEELGNATDILKYLRTSKLNRYDQQHSPELDRLEYVFKSDKPVILFVDQVDGECGMYPDSQRLDSNASTVFRSCEEAVIVLDKIARENEWELIYKIHPIRNRIPDLPDSIRIIQNCDINELIDLTDVTITILSSVSFTATVREKAVVITGNSDMYGKGCTYEVNDPSQLEETIRLAIKQGVTNQMKDRFLKYLALMNKYYLYDDDQPREMRYGRKIDQLSFE